LFAGQGVLLDRSVFSDCVFADVNYEDRTISEDGKYKHKVLVYNKTLNVYWQFNMLLCLMEKGYPLLLQSYQAY